MPDEPRFRLTDDDLPQLEDFVRRERRARAWAPVGLAVDLGLVLFAIVMIGREAGPVHLWWAVPCLLGVGAIVAGVMWDEVFRGSGAADAILAGGAPTLVVDATVLGDEGDQPNPWTLEFDAEASGATYGHLDTSSWSLVRGQRYRLYLFGAPGREFHGMVLFELIDADRPLRRWRRRLYVDNQRWYVNDDL